ncbi:hypothetical protein [Marinoscillum furvescens]|uniref:Glycosyl transferase family 1 n=1 Tax=Marinoscillum furvescens DSM 4134 TaxID=1122208 RepID=A0A3D9L6C3_MARFU|nr:hypothetical protein [Marinoscillum furvescens]RED99551.1 hypothetical protein C7460_108173 [Marinoscillum furvescens DSM 4134]
MKKINKKSAALLVHRQGYWAYDTALVCEQLSFKYLKFFDTLKAPGQDLNPYHLEPADQVDIVYIASHSFRYILKTSTKNEQAVVDMIRKYCNQVILIDGWDSFDLSVEPQTVELVDKVLKTNGVYRDMDLYNWKVGCDYPGVNWTQKITPKSYTYSPTQLNKVHLAYPCFLGILPGVRNKLRWIKTNNAILKNSFRFTVESLFDLLRKKMLVNLKPNELLHFLGDLGHYQRYELLRLLTENNIAGKYGVFRVLRRIAGTPNWRDMELDESKYNEIVTFLQSNDLIMEKKNRILYLLEQLNYWVSLSPTGFGELCFRHGEALSLKRLLICQDLSHVKIRFPFENGKNVIYTDPGFENLLEIVSAIQKDPEKYDPIRQSGFDAWNDWVKDYQNVLTKSLVKFD